MDAANTMAQQSPFHRDKKKIAHFSCVIFHAFFLSLIFDLGDYIFRSAINLSSVQNWNVIRCCCYEFFLLRSYSLKYLLFLLAFDWFTVIIMIFAFTVKIKLKVLHFWQNWINKQRKIQHKTIMKLH